MVSRLRSGVGEIKSGMTDDIDDYEDTGRSMVRS